MRARNTKSSILLRIRRILAAAALAFAFPGAAAATTINVVGAFGGGQLGTVNFDINFTADFTVNHFSETAGVTVNSLTSTVFPGQNPFALTASPISFTYHAATGFFIFGGGNPNFISASETDFFFRADNPLTTVSHTAALDSLASAPSTGTNLNAFVTVTQIAAVPLPAGLPLFLSGLAGLAALIRLGKRKPG